jgi:hypothetical protein
MKSVKTCNLDSVYQLGGLPVEDNVEQHKMDALMLALAAISYRGYGLVVEDSDKHHLMHQAMSRCLREYSTVADQWEIVWGPASFTPAFVGFADCAMYVAQHRTDPSTYAIAVRGTNPVCLLDWIVGDFLVLARCHGHTGRTPQQATQEYLSVPL